jgi:hypothetical protein
MGSQHIDANHGFDLFFGRQVIDKLLDWNPSARLAKIFDPPIHDRMLQDISCVLNGMTICAKRKGQNGGEQGARGQS